MSQTDIHRHASALVHLTQTGKHLTAAHHVAEMSREVLESAALYLAASIRLGRGSHLEPASGTVGASLRASRIVAEISGVVSGLTGVPVADIHSRDRRAPVARARQVVCAAAYRHGLTTTEIARAIDRDHGTVSNSMKRVREDPSLSSLLADVLAYLSERGTHR